MSIYQPQPDTYDKPLMIARDRPSTNERYKPNFKQHHFTAGDISQFEKFRNSRPFPPSSSIPQGSPEDLEFSEVFQNPTHLSVEHTFKYLFYKFKKGLFIQIRNGRLRVFLPFSNNFYVNEWHGRFQEPLPSSFQPSKTILPLNKWYANNYLFRCENPIIESDLGMTQMKHMFEELCKTFKVPDIELFVNKRDFPLLKRNLTEPYDAVFGHDTPLVSHKYEAYSLLLSMVSHPEFADVAIPTPDDWTRVCNKEGIFFPSTKRTLTPVNDNFPTAWEAKKPVAVFRGSNTGCGLREKLKNLVRGDARFDVKILKGSERAHIHNNKIVEHTSVSDLPSSFLSLEEQSRYKYIIHIQGHVQAFRLSIELAMRSVILLVDCPYKLWFEHKLIPYKHYVPVASDLSDLIQQLEWCQTHDEACQEIAENVFAFYETELSKEACLKRLYQVVLGYRTKMCRHLYIYPPLTIPDFQTQLETQILMTAPRKSLGTPNAPLVSMARNYWGLVSYYSQRPTMYTARNSILFQSKNSVIQDCGDRVIKTSKTILIHEAVVGLKVVNKLLQKIPNFVYTIEYNPVKQQLVSESFAGMETMDVFLKGRHFSFEQWINILQQICLVSCVGYRSCFFVHGDMCPWNIVLYKPSQPLPYDYAVGGCEGGGVYRVDGECIPILLDYGRSTAMADQVLLFQESIQTENPFQDCLCIFVYSLYLMLRNQTLTPFQCSFVLGVCNEVLNEPMYFTGAKSISELNEFLREAHCFAHITFAPKGALLRQSPMVLFHSLQRFYKQTRRPERIQEVSGVERTHIGTFSTMYTLPEGEHPLVKRYLLQMLWTMTASKRYLQQVGGDVIPLTQRDLNLISFPSCVEGCIEGNDIVYIEPKMLEALCILQDMMSYGGVYALQKEEQELLEKHFKPQEAMNKLLRYAIKVFYFKLYRADSGR